MTGPLQLVCKATGETYDPDIPRWCSETGGLLDLDFTPSIDPIQMARRPPTLWRYREAIPIPLHAMPVSLGEGITPLVKVMIGGKPVLIKQDHLFPTGSYKDRGAAVMVSKMLQLGVRQAVEDSSGNAGCSVAAYCARAGIACDIFVPETTSPSKLIQMEYYGATVHRIPGTREDTAHAALTSARRSYYASHIWNPWFLHGTKTFAYEVAEQLGWKAPDTIVLPVGNGTLLLGASIGFGELVRMGVITRLPRIVGVQAEACAPLARLFVEGGTAFADIPSRPIIAEGIAIAEPVRWRQILEAVRNTGGEITTVSEEEIRTALLDLGRKGFFVEPTAAAAIVGVAQQTRKAGGNDEVVVSVFSGTGLKAATAMGALLHARGQRKPGGRSGEPL